MLRIFSISLICLGLGLSAAFADEAYPGSTYENVQQDTRSLYEVQPEPEEEPVKPAGPATDSHQASLEERMMNWDLQAIKSELDKISRKLDAMERDRRFQDDKIRHLERDIDELKRRR